MNKDILQIKNLSPVTKAELHAKIVAGMQRFLGVPILHDINPQVNYMLNTIVRPYLNIVIDVKVEIDTKSKELNMKFNNQVSEYLFRTIGL